MGALGRSAGRQLDSVFRWWVLLRGPRETCRHGAAVTSCPEVATGQTLLSMSGAGLWAELLLREQDQGRCRAEHRARERGFLGGTQVRLGRCSDPLPCGPGWPRCLPGQDETPWRGRGWGRARSQPGHLLASVCPEAQAACHAGLCAVLSRAVRCGTHPGRVACRSATLGRNAALSPHLSFLFQIRASSPFPYFKLSCYLKVHSL